MLWRIALVALIAVPAIAEDKRPATKDEVAELRASVKELREQVAELRARVDALIDAVNAHPEPTATHAGNDDRIAKAIRDKKVVAGMTFAQVEGILGKPTETMEQGEGGDVYRWTVSSRLQVLENSPAPSEVGVYTLIVHFRGSKAVTFNRIEHAEGVPDQRPPRRR